MLRQAETPEERQLAQEMAGAFLSEQLDERVFGQPRAAEGCWASLVRVIDPLNREVLQTVRLEQNDGLHWYVHFYEPLTYPFTPLRVVSCHVKKLLHYSIYAYTVYCIGVLL